jgi:hypothetical protein
MTDQLEQDLRDALSRRGAQLDADPMIRLAAIDYGPRRHRIGKLPAIGALGATGVAAGVAAVVALGSSAAPAFAGWQSTPTAPVPGQLSQAAEACGHGSADAVLTDTRGPYTLSIYDNSTSSDLCLSGNSVTMFTTNAPATAATVSPGEIAFGDMGTRDLAGNTLTLADGRVGAGVTAVTLERADGSSVDATVSDGWFVAWWPGTTLATNAEVTTASGTHTVAIPALPVPSAVSPSVWTKTVGDAGVSTTRSSQ